ncbi:anti-sigma F factor [Sinanaerobacter sp. ZZT-01]|uniref:anti-sigma F factor n=1 Tax=Sinanaerobacter sp. ZZT-01 TaxID=3111540 RepID=UPI002D787793|nr:anti-sigma F factor [Sinanaerobacter sp. ZZT-01]WRR92649.1 anti-sigma F factor [Sinanaerobacter sp. ZZT-01]
MKYKNEVKLQFPSHSENEAFSRAAVAAFAVQLDPTVEELTEIKTAISEAVSNAIIHAYDEAEDGLVTVEVKYTEDRRLIMIVSDDGVGIGDIEKAKEPLYTSKGGEERSGMGFTVMESFTDRLEITSKPGEGTKVTMMKQLDSLL